MLKKSDMKTHRNSFMSEIMLWLSFVGFVALEIACVYGLFRLFGAV